MIVHGKRDLHNTCIVSQYCLKINTVQANMIIKNLKTTSLRMTVHCNRVFLLEDFTVSSRSLFLGGFKQHCIYISKNTHTI